MTDIPKTATREEILKKYFEQILFCADNHTMRHELWPTLYQVISEAQEQAVKLAVTEIVKNYSVENVGYYNGEKVLPEKVVRVDKILSLESSILDKLK